MKKIKILQFSIAATKGGRTRYILNLWKNIDRSLIKFDFITFSKSLLDFEDELLQDDCIVHHLRCRPEDDKSRFISEFEDILSNRYDAIEIHTPFWKDTIVEDVARNVGIPKIIIRANSAGINATLDVDQEKAAIDRHMRIRSNLTKDIATDYWACSEEAADWLFADRIPKDLIKIHRNTIDTNAFVFSLHLRKQVRERLGIKNRFVIGFSGRLEAVKNVDYIIDLFYSLRNMHGRFFLLVLGNGSLREHLEEKCFQLGINEDVCFMGHVDRVTDYLQAMDVFLMPSLFEGFPNALLEAQSVGLPCIISTGITKDAMVTELVHRVPLNQDEWTKIIMKYVNGYDRIDRSHELREKGYSTIDYIKQLQMEYLE